MTTVLPPAGRGSRIVCQARRVIAGAFAADPGVATTSTAGWQQRAGLIRLCDEAPRILDTGHGVTDEVRTRSEAALAEPMAARQSADEYDQWLTCVPARQDDVDLVTIAYPCGMVAEWAWS